MEQTASRVLIVDDEPDIRTIVRILLSADGYDVLEAANGRQALEQLQNHTAVDLVLLDIMMPEMDGVTACQEIRKYSMAPILFLTAKSQESDKLQAYYSGGDDFLTKPFSKAELLMKVKSLLRRYQVYRGKHELEAYTKAGVVSLDGRSVYKDGQTIEVTETEAEIIRYLLEHRGQPVSVENIYEDVWHEKYMPSSTNTVMVHILNLRKKLELDPANPTLIRTVWGKGYQID